MGLSESSEVSTLLRVWMAASTASVSFCASLSGIVAISCWIEVVCCFSKDVKKTKHKVVRYVDWKVCSRVGPTYMCED